MAASWARGDNEYGQLGEGTALRWALTPSLAVNGSATALFDLLPEVANDPGNTSLFYFARAQRRGLDLRVTLTDLRAAGFSGEIYFTALVPADSPLLGATRSRAGAGQAVGVFMRGGFKQTGGQVLAEPTYRGDLGYSGEQAVYTTRSGADPIEQNNALICMGLKAEGLSGKGQVLMRPIASGNASAGVQQCPPVQTAEAAQRHRVFSSGPLAARTVLPAGTISLPVTDQLDLRTLVGTQASSAWGALGAKRGIRPGTITRCNEAARRRRGSRWLPPRRRGESQPHRDGVALSLGV